MADPPAKSPATHPPGPLVFGPTIDDQTRCIHYGTAVDIVAIKFFCCRQYYPCHLCHAETAEHEARQWPRARWNDLAILCGECKTEIAVTEYLAVTACPGCGAEFNEGCRLHSHLYFETDAGLESDAPSRT